MISFGVLRPQRLREYRRGVDLGLVRLLAPAPVQELRALGVDLRAVRPLLLQESVHDHCGLLGRCLQHRRVPPLAQRRDARLSPRSRQLMLEKGLGTPLSPIQDAVTWPPALPSLIQVCSRDSRPGAYIPVSSSPRSFL